jgi:ribosomal protein S18 acetylase RimI-like enzyme
MVRNKKDQIKVDFIDHKYQNCGKYNPIIYLIEKEKIIAFLKINEYNDDQIAIEYFKVKKSNQNKGYGKKTINYLIKSYPQSSISIEVRVSNFIAIKLYEKFNFKIINKIKNYYQEPNEDGYYMLRYKA